MTTSCVAADLPGATGAITPRRRIAIAARDVVGTGGGTVAIETARYLAQAGATVRLIVDSDIPAPPAGVDVEVTPWGRRLKAWTPRGKIAFRVRQLLQILAFCHFGRRALDRCEKAGFVSIDHNLEACGADIAVLHNVFIAQYRADQRSLLRRLPQFANPVFGLRLLRERLTLRARRVRVVVAVSESTLVEARPQVPASKAIEVIESGINLERFHMLADAERERLRRERGVEGRFVLIFVGHEFERKRLDLVIDALAALPEQVVLWVLGGRMSRVENYVELARKRGVEGRVTFLGTHPAPEELFGLADVFVLPSDYETWGLVTLEAMACGVPAIMTPVGCAPRVIQDGETGYVVPSDARAIAERVRLLLDSPAGHARSRRAARAMAERFGWLQVAQRYLALADQVDKGQLRGA
jgi:glycosyltransferase involved in cell wall biosynthesis